MPGGKRRFWILTAVCVAVFVALTLLVVFSGEDPVPTQRLADGTVVSIAKVSYGKTHRLVVGNLWQRAAVAVLPESMLRRFKLRSHLLTYTNATDTTVGFVQFHRPNPGFAPGSYYFLGVATAS